MNILVTGGFGFIGSNFILRFIDRDDINILNYDNLTYAGNKDNLKHIENYKNYEHVISDICNEESARDVIRQFNPNIIIHFAAESHVDRSIEDPFKFIRTNIFGTSVLLNESLKYYEDLSLENKNKFKFIYISTDEVYGSIPLGSFSEESNFAPNSPYSASKASAEHLVRAWHKTFNLPVNILNCTNNYGPLQYPEKLIPLTILNCIQNKPIPIYGDGKNVRDWIYVTDHCDAIYSVIKNADIGQKYNIGSGYELMNIELVKIICSIMDSERPSKLNKSYEELITFVDDRPGHDFRYSLNIDKIRKELKWNPQEDINKGIEKTVKWYISNADWLENLNKKGK